MMHSKRKAQNISLALLIVCGALWLLTDSLLKHDYGVKPRAMPVFHRIRPELSVQPFPPGCPQVIAVLSLFNDDRERINLLNTAALDPLFLLQLEHRAGSEAFKPAPIVPQFKAMAEEAGSAFNPERDGVAELVPGSGLTRRINLRTFFNLNAPGTYRLTATYQPGVLARAMGPQFDGLDADPQTLRCSTEFTVPAAETALPEAEKLPKSAPAPSKLPAP